MLVVLGRCLAPLVSFLHGVEYTASSAWFERQLVDAIDGKFQTRVEEATSMRRVDSCYGDQRLLFNDSSVWLVMPPACRTVENRGIAYAIIARPQQCYC
jgi:hypothetical protein